MFVFVFVLSHRWHHFCTVGSSFTCFCNCSNSHQFDGKLPQFLHGFHHKSTFTFHPNHIMYIPQSTPLSISLILHHLHFCAATMSFLQRHCPSQHHLLFCTVLSVIVPAFISLMEQSFNVSPKLALSLFHPSDIYNVDSRPSSTSAATSLALVGWSTAVNIHIYI